VVPWLGAAVILFLGSCSDDDPAPPAYDPDIPEQWADAVTNPFFKLVPGTIWEYREEGDEGTETVTVEVLNETRVVNGVNATVVRDRVYLDGELVEDTFDWYAEDSEGNVWYLGEDSKEIEDGEVVSTEGSWEWGVDGALPGNIMWADPAEHVGEEYRQEFYEDEAEDWGMVVGLDRSVDVPLGNFSGCLETEDWNALEGGGHERKFYSPAVGGVVLEISPGGDRVELVSFTEP
jgi:hypothetical protein